MLWFGVSVLWAAERTVSVDAEREARTELEEQSVRVTIRNRPIGARVWGLGGGLWGGFLLGGAGC